MELGEELMKLEQLLAGSGLLMEKYQKKVINLEREKNDLKANYDQLKPGMEASHDKKRSLQKTDTELKGGRISQLQIKNFQAAIQKILVEQKNFQKEFESMRRSKQMLASESVSLQNSLTRLKHEFRTRSYADRDMQIVKQEVQRVWQQKRLSDEQRKRKESELAKLEERLKDMEQKLEQKTANLNKAYMTLNVYKMILKEQQQQIRQLHEKIQNQSLIIEKQRQHLEKCLNELESLKIDQKQTLQSLEIKMEEEYHLKDLLSKNKEENMKLKMDLFILQERLSESQHQLELAATKLKWNEKYWSYYQSRLEAQDNELRNMKIGQEYIWIKDLCSTLTRKDVVICTMDKQLEDVSEKVDGQVIKSLSQKCPSLMHEPSLDDQFSPSSIPAQPEYKTKIEDLEMELQKKSALLETQEKYNKQLEYHISLINKIFLGKFCKK